MLKNQTSLIDMRLSLSQAIGSCVWHVREFANSLNGNVAMMFGICLVPIMLSAGIAVDLSRALIVRERLAQALDATALAVGRDPGLTNAERQQLANDYFNANYPASELGVPGSLSINAGDTTVSIQATADVATTLLAIFGYQSLSVNADTEVTRDSSGLEVVLVLDNTGSMSGSKIDALKTASNDLVDILFGSETQPNNLKIGLVPFSAAVNIGTDALASGWMDDTAQSTLAGHAFQPGVNVFDLYNQIPNRDWDGCVETRLPPYDTTDDAPSTSDPDTLWLPYFGPDEPDTGGYSNDYLPDVTGGTNDERQRYVPKYDGTNASGNGPLRGCTVPPLTPMTNVKQDLLDAIDAMGASGYTHVPVGMVWGWRVISPTEPFTEGAAYNDQSWNKAIIVLTDGENTIDSESTHNGSNYSAYGYLAEGRLGTTSNTAFVDQIDNNLTTVCDAAKAEEIIVYSITFQVSSSTIQNLMRGCATSDNHYFDSPSNSDLQTVFQAIAFDLSALRLSQ